MLRCATYRPRSVRGFTLVELLVTLGILSTLIAILIPSLAHGTRHAMLADCANNMHQMHGGNMMYAMDNNFHRPPIDWWMANETRAIIIFAGTTTKRDGKYVGQGRVLNQYMDDNIELMICKSVTIEGDNDMDREMWANSDRAGSSYLYQWVLPTALSSGFPTQNALEQHIDTQRFVNDNGADIIMTDLNVRNIPGLDEPFLSHREMRRINLLSVDGAVRNYSYDYGLIAERWSALDIIDFLEAAANARNTHSED